MKLIQRLVKEFTSIDEVKKVMSKKGDYAFGKDTSKDISYVTYKGKVISTGDFDSGADGWFMDIKGEKGQKFFDKPSEVISFFLKKNITEAKKVKAGRGNMHIDVDPDAIPDKFSGPKWMGQMEKKHGMMIRFRKDSYVISGQKKGIVSFVTTELGWDQDDIENMWPELLEGVNV